MPSVLLTAFEPYDRWPVNSSWLTLVQITKELPAEPRIVTRRYPVDFGEARKRIERDLADGYDYVLHLGQAPGTTMIRLESVGINVAGLPGQAPEDYRTLVDDGPVAYRSQLPLGDWAKQLRAAGIPAQVSYHGGTYLCNAALYLAHHISLQRGLQSKIAFIHLPLDTSQVVGTGESHASLPVEMMARGIRLILAELSQM